MESKLKQLIQETIFESLSPDTQFSTKIGNRNISFYNFADSDIGVKHQVNKYPDFEAESEMVVNWELNIDARESAIKSIDLNVINVYGTIIVTPDPEVEGQITIPFNAKELGFEIEEDIKIKNHSAIFPEEIEIDFKSRKIKVTQEYSENL